ncbi:MAG: LTA synthase family protein [Eubacterium sp.]|nr:LTA synthase family protein [Eubacterium sp.]
MDNKKEIEENIENVTQEMKSKKSNKGKSKAKKIIIVLAVLAVLGAAGLYILDKYDIPSYIKNRKNYSQIIDRNYKDTKKVKLKFPEKKRNLIFVYLESMETTYADEASGGESEENYIPELTKLDMENECFRGDSDKINGPYVLDRCWWTMSGMFAQTTGLPLYSKLIPNETSIFENTFYPGVTSLGDILNDQGYKQVILMGEDGGFASTDVYYKTHGDFEIHDYYYAQEHGDIPKDYFQWNGYEDKKLFEIAKKEITELSQKDEPFNYTMATMDTHPEGGYVCDLCKDEFDDQYENVIACSSKQLGEFVEWIKEQPFYDNTTVILSGDHCTMDMEYAEKLSDKQYRHTYMCIINSAVKNDNPEKREYATIDVFPTTLASLGVDIKGDRLGLGTNLYSKKKTMVERYGVDLLNIEVFKDSQKMKTIFYSKEEDDYYKKLEKQESGE